MKNHFHENLNDSFLQQIIKCVVWSISILQALRKSVISTRGPDTDDQYTNMQIFKAETESIASFHCFYQVLQKPHHLRK